MFECSLRFWFFSCFYSNICQIAGINSNSSGKFQLFMIGTIGAVRYSSRIFQNSFHELMSIVVWGNLKPGFLLVAFNLEAHT